MRPAETAETGVVWLITQRPQVQIPSPLPGQRPGGISFQALCVPDAGIMAVMIGRLHHVVLDCPRPLELAAFYSELLGQPVTYQSDDWVVVASNDASSGLAFQLAADYLPPTWPDPAVPLQVHLDIMVEDVTSSGPGVLALGATKLDGGDVYADPAGHPFCLIQRPGWASPIPLTDDLDNLTPKP